MRTTKMLSVGSWIKQIDAPNLNGLIREAANPGDGWLQADMLAQVHEALLANHLIADPHAGKNAAACAWVGEKDWAYACRFETPGQNDGPVFLRFDGLDTLVDAYVNGGEFIRRCSAWPPMWQYRSVGGSWDKVGPIERYCDPVSAEDLIRVLGTAHGEYMHQRIVRHRRGVPDGAPDGSRRCWGTMPWRLNDSWPIIYWSVVDYYLLPKIPFYFLKRAYKPVLVCFEPDDDRICAWVVNDSPDAVSGRLTVRHRRFDGAVRGEMSADVSLEPGTSRRWLDLTDFGPISLRHAFLEASFGGETVTHLLMGERYLHLPQAELSVRAVDGRIAIASDVFARQVALDMPDASDAVFEDNFFDLAPKEEKTVALLHGVPKGEARVQCLNGAEIRVAL